MLENRGTTILAIGAHPDDIEFGAGGILLKEQLNGSRIELAICSKGEAGSNGTAEEREQESERAAAVLGARLRFLDLGGDGQMEATKRGALAIARLIRELKPLVVIAPSLEENQHPDHAVVARLTRDACRLARYGGLGPLRDWEPHAVQSLFYYAITPEAEPRNCTAMMVDIGMVFEDWVKLMECHASQMKTRNYIELQTSRARVEGLRIGSEYSQALYPSDRLVIKDLATAPSGARCF